MENVKLCIVSGIMGAVVFCAILCLIWLFALKMDYRPIVLLNPEQVCRQEIRDSVSIPEADLMLSLREKGILLTPTEYTNNLVNYYNTLIAFLGILFILFSFAGYLCIRNVSRKEVREQTRAVLSDSARFREDVFNALNDIIEKNYVKVDDYANKVENIERKLEDITGAMLTQEEVCLKSSKSVKK